MERQNDRAYWKNKAAQLLKKQRGILNVNLERRYEATETLPAVGGEDGVYVGIMNMDMSIVMRDSGTESAMTKEGYDIKRNAMEQIRFRRPGLYKCIKDSLIAVQATNEPVLGFITEYAPSPQVHLLKVAPAGEGRVMWTCIDVTKLAATTVRHWGPEVAEYLEENKLMI